MKESPRLPLAAEVVQPGAGSQARLAALLVAAAPLLARLGWWWWTQGRRRAVTTLLSAEHSASTLERTEVEIVRRTLGRRRVRVVSTRWLVPAAPVLATSVVPARGRRRWLRPALRLATLALPQGSRTRPIQPQLTPRLTTPPPPRRRLSAHLAP